MMMAPAARSRAIAGSSSLGWKPLYAALPQVADKRAAKMLSLI
jgi:hypothetical protein